MKSIDMAAVRRFCIALHRDLGFLFAGVVIIYALSGIFMNHRDKINPSYTVEITEISLDGAQTSDVTALAALVGEEGNLIKHFNSKGSLKLLFKGGSSLVVSPDGRTATYEKVSRRLIISDMVRLHYNPSKWWAAFSDIFAVSLILITLTGIIIVKGNKGIVGRGGLLLIAGILIPLLFLLV